MSSTKFVTKLRGNLKMGKKEGHRNDGNYYPAKIRPAADVQSQIRDSIKEQAEYDAYFKAIDIPLPPPNRGTAASLSMTTAMMRSAGSRTAPCTVVMKMTTWL